MKQETWWRCSDGQAFESMEDAARHEGWLATLRQVDVWLGARDDLTDRQKARRRRVVLEWEGYRADIEAQMAEEGAKSSEAAR